MNIFSINDFGAKSGGIKKNTEAIAAAIDAASKAGGGTVIIPRGLWLTGPIELKSGITLHTEDGAVVMFSDDDADYPLVKTDWEGNRAIRCQSPISGRGLSDIAITGNGVFDGNGSSWRPLKQMKVTERQWQERVASGGYVEKGKECDIWWPSEDAYKGSAALKNVDVETADPNDYIKYKRFLRPSLLQLRECSGVTLSGATFQNSPAWCLHLLMCEDVKVFGINVRNPWFSQNGDGIDVECCKNVIIADSRFDVGDDAICMKSGKDEYGRKLGRPTENVEIKNCTVYHGHGGFVVGSEMSGGVRDVRLYDCSFIGTDTGLRFKSCRGRGGVVENISISGVNMTDIKNEAIIFTTSYAANGTPDDKIEYSEKTPEFRNIKIENVSCCGCRTPISISGLPEMPIHDIELSDITIKTSGEVETSDCENVTMNNVDIIK